MKIVVATGIFPPEIGGPATYLREIVPLLKQKAKVEVVTYGKPRPNCITVSRSWPFPLRVWLFYRTMLRVAKDADVILCTDVFSAGLASTLAAKKLNKPLVVRFVGDVAWEHARNVDWARDPFETFQHRRYGLRIELMRWLQHWVVRNSTRVLTVSTYLAELVKKWGAREVVVVSNSVPKPPKRSKAALRKKWRVPQDEFVVASVGRLVNYKRVDDIIRAVPTTLLIGGDGPDRKRLEGLAGPNVRFLGSLEKAQTQELITLADVLVIASEYEGMSHTMLEAMSLGTPVVASDVPGNAEFIKHGKNGWLFPLGNVKKLHALLKRADLKRVVRTARASVPSQKKWLRKNLEVIQS